MPRVESSTSAIETSDAQRRRPASEERLGHFAEQLATARAQHDALLNLIPDPAWLKAADSTYIAVNRAVADVAGCAPGDMVGSRDAEIYSADLAARFLAEDRAVIDEGCAIRVEESHTAADGTVRAFDIVKVPIVGPDGVIAGTAGIARDVTARKRAELEAKTQTKHRRAAERALLAADRHLSAIIDMSPLATVAVDRDRRVILWNRAAEELFGWSADEVLGQPYCLIAPEDETQPEALFADAFNGECLSGVSIVRNARDGTRRDLTLWNAQLRDNDGAIIGLVGLMADTSERRQLEAQLLQGQKLEAVGRLAGGIAHDFNNILTAVGGHADLLLEEVRTDPGFEQCGSDPAYERLGNDLAYDQLVEIRRGVSRAAELTRQLMAFSRKQVMQVRVVDLRGLMCESQRMIQRLIGEDIQLTVRHPADLWCVSADAVQLEQVLLNLAVNSRDAMPRGGRFDVELSNVVVGTERVPSDVVSMTPGEYVLLQVRDTGSGIPADVLPHIFEPFYTSKPAGKGTGLGLSTVYGIVKQSGGYIFVASEVQRGTTFSVYLPRTEGSPESRSEAPRRTAAGGTETILLVEDDPAVRALLIRVLRRKGYRVMPETDGRAALERADRTDEPIDLLVSDVIMPHMNGRDLAERLRLRRPDLKVLFVSGYSEDMISEHGVLNAGIHFLQKPFTPGELEMRVRSILDPATAPV